VKDLQELSDKLETMTRAAATESRTHIPLEVGDAIHLVNTIRSNTRELDNVMEFLKGTSNSMRKFLNYSKET